MPYSAGAQPLPRRRVRWRLITLIVAVVVVAAAGGWWLLQMNSGRARPPAPVAQHGVQFRSVAGGFAVVFPAAATALTHTVREGAYTLHEYGGSEASGHSAAIGATIQPGVGSTKTQPFLTAVISGVAGGPGTRVTGERATTFEHHPARLAQIHAGANLTLTVLATLTSAKHAYVLIAPPSSFAALSRSFTALP